MKDIFKTDRLINKNAVPLLGVVPNLRFIGLCDRGTLRCVRLCLTTPCRTCMLYLVRLTIPLSASPDFKLAHNTINSNLNYNSFKVSIPPVAVGARKQAAAILLPKQMQSCALQFSCNP